MKVIIAGSRNIPEKLSEELVDTILTSLFKDLNIKVTEVVSGTARGGDKIGEAWAYFNAIPVKKFPANWDKYGKRAGYLRNSEMAEYGEMLVAIWDGSSKGTKHMIDLADKKGVKVSIIMFNPEE